MQFAWIGGGVEGHSIPGKVEANVRTSGDQYSTGLRRSVVMADIDIIRLDIGTYKVEISEAPSLGAIVMCRRSVLLMRLAWAWRGQEFFGGPVESQGGGCFIVEATGPFHSAGTNTAAARGHQPAPTSRCAKTFSYPPFFPFHRQPFPTRQSSDFLLSGELPLTTLFRRLIDSA